MSDLSFTVVATATGEVRDAEGHLLDAGGHRVPEGAASVTATRELTAADMATFSDDQLRKAGLTSEQIQEVRQKGQES